MKLKTVTLAAAAFLAAQTAAFAQSQVFAIDVRPTPNRLLSWATNATSTAGVSIVSANANYDGFAIDFNTAGTQLFGINGATVGGVFGFGTIDMMTGNFSLIANLSGLAATDNVTGLRIDPISGVHYVSTGAGAGANSISQLNPMTGALTGRTAITGLASTALIIDIAISNTGQMYGLDIASDTLVLIDKFTGVATSIGAIGFNANFAQGMDFDMATNTLYATIYTGGGTGVFASINLATGAATQLFSTTALNAEMEMAIRPVPEPTTIAFVGLGLAGLAWHRLRKKK